jgi:hypothetical protein
MTTAIVLVRDHRNADKPGITVVIRKALQWQTTEMYVRHFPVGDRAEDCYLAAASIAHDFAVQLGEMVDIQKIRQEF